MEFLVVALTAMLASGLTLFSGFGLGTLLLPAFALFFPVDVAVAATAAVHGANNVVKVALLGRHAERRLVLRFGLPAIGAAFLGAGLLGLLSGMEPLVRYQLFGREAVVTPVKLVLAVLMAFFAAFELMPRFRQVSIDPRYLPVGGVLSGFFGGLSGHQGALRSAFLAKLASAPTSFVGTNAVIGLFVDAVRLTVYGAVIFGGEEGSLLGAPEWRLIGVGMVAAFTGVLVGKRLLHKVTMVWIQVITGTLLLLISLALGSGFL